MASVTLFQLLKMINTNFLKILILSIIKEEYLGNYQLLARTFFLLTQSTPAINLHFNLIALSFTLETLAHYCLIVYFKSLDPV